MTFACYDSKNRLGCWMATSKASTAGKPVTALIAFGGHIGGRFARNGCSVRRGDDAGVPSLCDVMAKGHPHYGRGQCMQSRQDPQPCAAVSGDCSNVTERHGCRLFSQKRGRRFSQAVRHQSVRRRPQRQETRIRCLRLLRKTRSGTRASTGQPAPGGSSQRTASGTVADCQEPPRHD